MDFTFLRTATLALCAAVVLWTPTAVLAQSRFLNIGTGGVAGVYYAAGGAICRLVNRDRMNNSLRCFVESTAGSATNVDYVKRAVVTVALVQSDVHYMAYKGEGEFAAAGAQDDMRSIFSVYPEVLTVLLDKDLVVKTVADFKGKRMSAGLPGSGNRATTESMFAAFGGKLTDLAPVVEKTPNEQGYALCEKSIDGFAYVVGHPVANVQRVIQECGARLLPVSGPEVEVFLQPRPYYVRADIPGGLYPGHPEPTPSVALMATVVTNASTPETTVYAMVKAVFDNFEEFKTLHPAFASLQARDMVRRGLTAPLHPGALRYYREKGWL